MKPEIVFEVSWEICNKVGGIYTVLSSKARSVREKYGDNYILVGPDVWKETTDNPDFIEDPELFKAWKAVAWDQGLKVRTGRWNIKSKPLVILVDFTPLFAKKDEIFARLWEDFQLDSLTGQWDYIEPAMFGYAVGQVIESFAEHSARNKNVLAHFHEWMTGTGILYLKKHDPRIGTAFTTHATVLGRSIAGNGLPLYEKLKSYNPYEMADRFNVRSKNSLETLSAVHADAFTTVSSITAMECKQFFKKKPDVITINGFDESFVPSGKTFSEKRKKAREKALEIASKLTGKTFDNNTFLVINSGRYEFRNKGIDLFIKSLGVLNKDETLPRDVVAFITVPAGHGEVNKVFTTGEKPEGHDKYLTHYLWDGQNDPVVRAAASNGLENNINDHVTLVFLPAYLDGNDGVAGLTYYDFLIGFDYSVFPSYYEPWGYTPMESIAFKVPTVTTSVAGFGDYVRNNVTVRHHAVTVVDRLEGKDDEAVEHITQAIQSYLSEGEPSKTAAEAERIFKKLLWSKLIDNYYKAWQQVVKKAASRKEEVQKQMLRPETRQVEVVIRADKPHWKKILVRPVLPGRLKPLKELAYNLWWSWNSDASSLFASILPEKWEQLEYNPVRLLEELSSDDHQRLENDQIFMKSLESVYNRFKKYMNAADKKEGPEIAYFSMEYGLHVSLKIYSGGLGVLAGDYLKQASDSNKNLFGIGLLYRYGYFNQKITYTGDQIAESIPQKFTQLPLKPVRDTKGEWVTVKIALPGRNVIAKAWQVDVGRIPLYLLDTDIEENSPEDRSITHHLYGGDRENRLKQEMLLGLGGIRLICNMGEDPHLFHSNEGHSAFIGLERIRRLMEAHSINFETAKELVKSSTLFTTHTPVPAGHDTFQEHLIRAYLSHFSNHFKISWETFIGLGRFNPSDSNEEFSMSVLAANLSQEINGVSRIHGKVSRDMFKRLYPGYYPEELHIGYVTNGVHYYTWTDDVWQQVYREFFGEGFEQNQPDTAPWQNVYDIPDAVIWDKRKAIKTRTIAQVKAKLKKDLTQRQENPKLILKSLGALDEDKLIIGFARRFATYKRAHLLFTNLERLEKIVNNKNRPVIFIFAGKAHPADKAGQDLIKRIIEVSKMPQFAGKILFLENYDMTIGKLLTSGVDVWLNTPTRPLEASGTSGEKAVMNGGLNFSVLDGWWAAAYKPGAGWAIEESKTYLDQHLQDELDAEIIYDAFESSITDTYYARNKNGLPETWITYIKNTIAQITPHFTMQRMLNDYYERFYNKLKERRDVLFADDFARARELSIWKEKVLAAWDKITVEKLIIPDSDKEPIDFGKYFVAEVVLSIPGLTVDDIGVELIAGNRTNGDIDKIRLKEELYAEPLENDKARYIIEFPLKHPGVYDYSFRVFPKHPWLAHRMDCPLVKWI